MQRGIRGSGVQAALLVGAVALAGALVGTSPARAGDDFGRDFRRGFEHELGRLAAHKVVFVGDHFFAAFLHAKHGRHHGKHLRHRGKHFGRHGKHFGRRGKHFGRHGKHFGRHGRGHGGFAKGRGHGPPPWAKSHWKHRGHDRKHFGRRHFGWKHFGRKDHRGHRGHGRGHGRRHRGRGH